MKIKKLLPLVLLAAAAVLMLSSCDAMLDVIFPSNQISVDVRVFAPTHPDYLFSPVTVVLNGRPYTEDWLGFDSSGYAHYYFDFEGLKDGVYTIYAYYYANSGPAFDDQAGPYVISLPDISSSNPDSSGHSASVLITMN